MTSDLPTSPDSSDLPAATEPQAPKEYVPPVGPVVARAGRYYRNVRYLMFAGAMFMAVLFLKDGFYSYPKENREFLDKHPGGKLPREPLDIRLQYLFGFALPPLAIGMLVFWLRRSRGELRLEGQTLSIPGHPPFALDDVVAIDKKLWDRKGIAFITYRRPDNTEHTFRLDDFIYERPPTDQIYDAIMHNIQARV